LATTVVWRTGQGPASSTARHLSTRFAAVAVATRTIVAELASAATLPAATTGPSGSAGAAVARSTTAISAARTTSPITVTTVEGIALALRPRHQIDDVEELATLLCALRSILPLQHAHEPDLRRPSPDHVERFHHAGKSVTFHLQSSTHRLGFGPFAQGGLWSRFGGGRFASSSLCRSIRSNVGARRLVGRACLDGPLFRRCRSWHWLCGTGFGLRVLCPVCPLGLCRPLQQNSGKLCDGLHWVRPSWRMSQGSCLLLKEAPVVDVLRVLVNGKLVRNVTSAQPLPGMPAILRRQPSMKRPRFSQSSCKKSQKHARRRSG
jgi:hypothetical protein